MKRVYVPTTLAVWQRLVANGSMFQVSGPAFAVTPGESYAEQHNAQSTCSSKACSVPRYKGVIGQGTVSQVLIRVGIAPTTNDAPATPRRPLDDVLQLTSPD